MCLVAQMTIINLIEFNTRVCIDGTCAVFPPPQLQLRSGRVILKIVSSLEFHKTVYRKKHEQEDTLLIAW